MVDKIATRDAYGEILIELGKKNKNIVALSADLADSARVGKFGREFPGRLFNLGVAEQDMMGTAAGLALAGKIPFVSTFAMFATGKAWDQVRNTICYCNLNVKIVVSHAGITVGPDGASHQSLEDITIMRCLPNMCVVVPSDGPSTKKLVEGSMGITGPVYIRLGRPKIPVIYDGKNASIKSVKIGKSVQLTDGDDASIFACGIEVVQALEAAKMLKEKGIAARVYDAHTIKPIDEEAIVAAANQTGAIVTCEEHSVIGGLGSAVSEVVAEKSPVPMERIGVRDKFGQSGTEAELMDAYGLTAKHILNAVGNVIKRKKK